MKVTREDALVFSCDHIFIHMHMLSWDHEEWRLLSLAWPLVSPCCWFLLFLSEPFLQLKLCPPKHAPFSLCVCVILARGYATQINLMFHFLSDAPQRTPEQNKIHTNWLCTTICDLFHAIKPFGMCDSWCFYSFSSKIQSNIIIIDFVYRVCNCKRRIKHTTLHKKDKKNNRATIPLLVFPFLYVTGVCIKYLVVSLKKNIWL